MRRRNWIGECSLSGKSAVIGREHVRGCPRGLSRALPALTRQPRVADTRAGPCGSERSLDARRPKTPAERQQRLITAAATSYIERCQRSGSSVLAPRRLYRAVNGRGGTGRSVHLAALAQPNLRHMGVSGGNHVRLSGRPIGSSAL